MLSSITHHDLCTLMLLHHVYNYISVHIFLSTKRLFGMTQVEREWTVVNPVEYYKTIYRQNGSHANI